ncbi:hypothetical protein HPB51_000026 [Rhipicephalus microplus]|uniref:THAP-type domain-containing protein n=1 Tax=Rhipicephalus microplus TaxID=6941 RepID=A0A9J6E4G3_RHIMP|nr:hypothetical protein HPB51_000026 [Rhipicephalus microplus]
MAYCCVPGCKSSSKKKEVGISFHETPSDEELRQKWIKVISRDNWTPNTTSCYSTVCSRHFAASYFKQGCKTRRLMKGVVPSVFEEYPRYLQPSTKAPRSDAAIRKRASVSECPTATKRRAVRRSKSDYPPWNGDDIPTNGDGRDMSPPACSITCEDGIPATRHQSDRAVQVSVPTFVPSVERMKWRRKERDLKAQIRRL